MRRSNGFTLIELMIVVALIAIIASIALPNLLSARISSNESAAIATLKHVISAESVVQTMGAIDTDNDGLGEYGWFGEMAGADNLRTSAGPLSGPLLAPPTLSKSIGSVNADGVSSKSGYFYRMSLPGPGGAPVNEAAGGGSPAGEDADLCEQYWILYCWPSSYTNSGRRVFCINQSGDLLQSNNQGGAFAAYDGLVSMPTADAAMEAGALGTITGSFSISGNPALAVDGKIWTAVN